MAILGIDKRSVGQALAWPVLPLVQTLRSYNVGKLRADAIAGVTVAVVEVPQAIAYAYIAGVPPEYGLYTSIVQGIIAGLLSSNDQLTSGPTNTQSILIAATVTRLADPGNAAMYLQLVIALTMLKGLVQMAFALARMGNLVRYVSESVVIGFAAGAGVLIAVNQVPAFLGLHLSDDRSSLPGVIGSLQDLGPHLAAIDWRAVALGALALGIMIGARFISKLAPGPLLAILVTGLIVFLAGWTSGELGLVGELPAPTRELLEPDVPVLSWQIVESLMAGAVALALLGMIETVAIGKTISAHGGRGHISANREFFAQGIANFIGSFLHNMPGSGSFTRSALSYHAGAATRISSVFNALVVLLIFVLFRGQARYIPMAALAAILFVVAYSLINWRYMVRIARTNRSDTSVCFSTFIAALVLPLQYAIYIGVFLNLALYLRQASRLHIAEMVRMPGGPYIERPLSDRQGQKRVMFLQIEGDLFFGVADELQERLSQLAATGVRVVIFRLKRTHSIDATVMAVLERFTRTMHERNGHVILCGLKPTLRDRLESFGLVRLIGRDNVFETGFGVFASAKRAVARARQLVGESLDIEGLELEDETEGWAYQI